MSDAILAAVNKVSFGVEELLTSGAQVYFESIFATRHIGRVVDFMIFQSQGFIKASGDPAYAEYRFRQMIELAVFNSWVNYREGERSKCVEIEFGWDKKRLVISVAHIAPAGVAGFVPGGNPVDIVSIRMAQMLTQIQALADGLMVRHDPASGRVQVVTFLTSDESEIIPEAQYLDLSVLPSEFEAPVVDAGAVPEAGAAIPEELSNGDLEAFVEDENAKPVAPEPVPVPVAEAEVVISGGGSGIDETETLVKGGPVEEEVVTRIAGVGRIEEDKTVTRIAADAKPIEEKTVTRIAADAKPIEEKTVTRISGDGQHKEEKAMYVVGGSGAAGPAKPVKEVMQLKRIESAGQRADAGAKRREELLLEKIRLMSEQITSLKSGAAAATKGSVADAGASSDQLREMREKLAKVRSENTALQNALSENNRAISDGLAKAATEEGESGAVMKYKQELDGGSVPAAAAHWAKGLMEAVSKERSELKQRTREIDSLLRRREFEFKTKEHSFNEQHRLHEDTVKSREIALEKAKDTIQNLSSMLDKLREEASGSQDKFELAHKLVTAEKLLHAEKESAERLQKRCDDMQKKLNDEVSHRGMAQQDVTKYKKLADDLQRKVNSLQEVSQKGSSAEIMALTDQREKGLRFIEELKRQNRELQAKITSSAVATKNSAAATQGVKGAPGPQSEAESKHKLELAERLAKSAKDELDKTKKRFEELKISENKLRGDLSKMANELLKAQADLKAAGLRSAGAATAAAKTGAAAAKPGKPKA